MLVNAFEKHRKRTDSGHGVLQFLATFDRLLLTAQVTKQIIHTE